MTIVTPLGSYFTSKGSVHPWGVKLSGVFWIKVALEHDHAGTGLGLLGPVRGNNNYTVYICASKFVPV